MSTVAAPPPSPRSKDPPFPCPKGLLLCGRGGQSRDVVDVVVRIERDKDGGRRGGGGEGIKIEVINKNLVE